MKEQIEYLLFLLLHHIARFVSYDVATRVGGSLGLAVFALTGIRMRVTTENLRHAFPEKTEVERQSIARGAYRNYGISITQMLWAGGASAEELKSKVHIASLEPLQRAIDQGRGVILLSAHFGSWELLPSSVRLQVGHPFVIIVQSQRNRKINAVIDGLRSRFDNRTVPMGPSVRRVLQALREKRIVAMLADQSGPKESVFVEFFGRPAATHRGPAVFSLRTNAPILMIFLVRRSDKAYDALFEEVDRSGLEAYTEQNILELTRRHTALAEKYIRQYPDHWLWMHKRWKHTPYFEAQQHAVEETAGKAVHRE